MPAEVGQAAPDFTLVGTDLKAVSLKDFAKKHVVLAFYPAAFTGVCEKELCTFRDALNDFVGANTAVVGVSVIREQGVRGQERAELPAPVRSHPGRHPEIRCRLQRPGGSQGLHRGQAIDLRD